MLGVFRLKLDFKCFFALQPPPAITDKQLDEREHTVEEWKGGNDLCFYLCFSIKSDWPYWTLLGHFFDLPAAHLILSTGETCRWLKLLTVWDATFVCRVDIQRSVGLGRKNEKWRHQGTAGINRLVEFMCLPSADGLNWAMSQFCISSNAEKDATVELFFWCSPSTGHTCVVTAPFVFGQWHYCVIGNQMKLNLADRHLYLSIALAVCIWYIYLDIFNIYAVYVYI